MQREKISKANSSSHTKRASAAVVLGCGGIRALAQLPFLNYLNDNNLAIQAIYGSGAGATLGALFAAGFSKDEIPGIMANLYNRKLYTQLDYSMVFKIMGLRMSPFESPPAPYKPTPLLEALKAIFGERRLEDLPLKLQVQATDMATGREVDLTSGLIYECLYASNATYPFLPPIFLDGKWLASGMFTAALPVMQAVQNNHDLIFVVGVNDTTPIASTEMVEYINTFFMRACTNTQARQITLAISLHGGEVVLLNVNFDSPVHLWDPNAVDEALNAGKKMVDAHRGLIDQTYRDRFVDLN